MRLLVGCTVVTLVALAACGSDTLTAPEPFDTAVLGIVPARPSLVQGDTMSFMVTNRSSSTVTTGTCWDVAWRRDTGDWVTDNGILPATCSTTDQITLAPGATRRTLLRVPATLRSAQYRVGYLAQRAGSGGMIATASDAFAVLTR
ncbi:MAG: hypothetical protein MUF00_05080 [Gemmatimonadaceae bacterium]|nr:hypothetical protein [Gemmatimonadaceae bacterium]